jgi:hypothetical protein
VQQNHSSSSSTAKPVVGAIEIIPGKENKDPKAVAAAVAASRVTATRGDVTRVVKIMKQNEPLVSER